MVHLFAGLSVADLGAILDLLLLRWNHLGERRVGDPVEKLLGGCPLPGLLLRGLLVALLDTLPIGRPPFDLLVEEAGNFVAHEVFGAENRAGASFFFVSGDSRSGTAPLITAVLRLRR